MVYNPKRPGHYKRACHELLEQIFGMDRAGTKMAYAWLSKNFGRQIHFSQITDEKELREIWEKLYAFSFKAHPAEVLTKVSPTDRLGR